MGDTLREGEFDMLYGGISKDGDPIDLSVAQSNIEKSISLHSFKSE